MSSKEPTTTVTSPEEDLQVLEGERTQLNEAITGANRTLQESSNRIAELTARISVLQPGVNAKAASQTALKNLRNATKDELEQARKAHSDLTKKLEQELPKDLRTQLEARFKAIDKPIKELEDDLPDLRQKVATAEDAAADAKKKATSADAAYRKALTELQQLPNQIETARTRVRTLKSDAQKKADSGKEAFLAAYELDLAIDRLKWLTDPERETEGADNMNQKWSDLSKAQDTVKTTTVTLDDAKKQVSDTEHGLQEKVQKRDAALKEALTTPAGEAPPTPPA